MKSPSRSDVSNSDDSFGRRRENMPWPRRDFECHLERTIHPVLAHRIYSQIRSHCVKKSQTWQFVIPKKPQHFMYKYTIAVGINHDSILILDPVLVPDPPGEPQIK